MDELDRLSRSFSWFVKCYDISGTMIPVDQIDSASENRFNFNSGSGLVPCSCWPRLQGTRCKSVRWRTALQSTLVPWQKGGRDGLGSLHFLQLRPRKMVVSFWDCFRDYVPFRRCSPGTYFRFCFATLTKMEVSKGQELGPKMNTFFQRQ